MAASGGASSSRMKWWSLVVLIVQSTALVLILRYSRTVKTDGERYLSSVAIFVSEIVKFVTCLAVIAAEQGCTLRNFVGILDIEIVQKPGENLKVAVPAVLYVVQNNLLFLALSNLNAATYQVTYQLKILTTALFSVTMLGRKLNAYKWTALVLLMVGVAIVQWPSEGAAAAGGGAGEAQQHSWSGQLVGLAAVLAACFSSGFSGVYFERILKGTSTSLWIRNLQLAFFSIFGAALMVLLYDYSKVQDAGFFQGFNFLTVVVVLLQAYGGLVIALVVKYADNILKGFAVSLSIILSSVLSYCLLGDFQPTLTFAFGALVVICSTFLYGYEPPHLKQGNGPPPSSVGVTGTGTGRKA